MKNLDSEINKLKSAFQDQAVPECPSQLKSAVLRELRNKAALKSDCWSDVYNFYFSRAAAVSFAFAIFAFVTFSQNQTDTPDTELVNFFSQDDSAFDESGYEEEFSFPIEEINLELS